MNNDGSMILEQPHAMPVNKDFSDFPQEKMDELLSRASKGEVIDNLEDSISNPDPEPAQPAPADKTKVDTPGSVESETTALASDEPAPPVDTDGTKVDLDNSEADPDEGQSAEKSKDTLLAEKQQLEKQLKHLQSLYGRQSNELGDLRRKVTAKPTQEEYDADPVAATEKLHQHKEQMQQIEAKTQELQRTAMITQNMDFHSKYTPELNSNIGAIKEMMVKEDGVSPTDAEQFASQVFMQNPLVVYNLNKRLSHYKEVMELKAQIEQLKKAPGKALERLGKVNKQAPAVRAQTGETSTPGESLIEDPVKFHKLSDKEIEAQLKKRLKQERG